MKISFIIPAFNEERHIELCLRSILALDGLKELSSWEIIVVDNASTDKTSQIVKNKFPQAKVVFEPKKGVTTARNSGAWQAKGDILVFFDADVEAPKDWLLKMAAILAENPGLVALSGPYDYKGLKKYEQISVESFFVVFAPMGQIAFSKVLKNGGIMMGGNIVIYRDVFVKAEGFDEKMEFWGDEASLAKKVIKYGDIKFDLNFRVKTSARRLKKEGLSKTAVRAIMNFTWPFLFNKPFSKTHQDIRDID